MEYFKYEKQGEIGILKVNRPEVLNALNSHLLLELKDFLEKGIKTDRLKVLIFTGEGQKAFIAGADLKEMYDKKHTEILDFLELGQVVTLLLENASFVTIAAVNGFALGGGLEMALACDFIYASRNAKLGLPEVTLGIIPGFGGTKRLAGAVGTRLAKEMIVTGKHLTAEEALALGIVNLVCDPEKLMEECLHTADKIAKHSRIAVQQCKNAVNYGNQMDIHEALSLERNMFALCFATKEREMAMGAFLEKAKIRG